MRNRFYDRKIVVSGNVVELYEYELPVVKSDRPPRIGRAGQNATTEEAKRLNREKVAARARQKVRRYANANFSNKSKLLSSIKALTNTQSSLSPNFSFNLAN